MPHKLLMATSKTSPLLAAVTGPKEQFASVWPGMLTPFLRHFARQRTLQAALASQPVALEGALAVVSRARHAALYARDWAVLRHDIEVDEVTTAALLHDLAELVLWCHAPDAALQISRMRQERPGRRSDAAQRLVLGFSLAELQLALVREWRLPPLLLRLMDDYNASTPRVLNVALAAAVARHVAQGWNDAALPDDYKAVGKLLGVAPQLARDRVVRVAVLAARDWQWSGVIPPAAWLPLIG